MADRGDAVDRVARSIVAEISKHGYTGDDGDGAAADLHSVVVDCEISAVDVARAAIEAHEAALSEAAYVIVPREPTEAMEDAGFAIASNGPGLPTPDTVWRVMIDAALADAD